MTTPKRSIMTLYSGALDDYSHQVRIVLAEKGVTVDVIQIDPANPPEDLLDVNPYGTVPTLIDRDLVLYEPRVIMEYLDERFPHPPLLPVYPVARAKCRLMMSRIEQDWYSLVRKAESANAKTAETARKELKESIMAIAPIFGEAPFFMSEEFSLVDCALTPLLWRLPSMNVSIPATAKAFHKYAQRMYARESFQASLSDQENELREADAA